jgi:hypothetical protein
MIGWIVFAGKSEPHKAESQEREKAWLGDRRGGGDYRNARR